MPNRFLPVPPIRAPLTAIITAARAGSLDYAWALFRAGGYDARPHDAAALAVKGRLLKEEALRTPPVRRAQVYLSAAEAYAAADALVPQPYTKINVATSMLLGGDRDGGCAIARSLLDRLESGAAIQETPYYIAATRAEAWLLCGRIDDATDAMADAIAHDPDGWLDRASTLRQFRQILAAMEMPIDWLDAFRPPRSLHYAGHLGASADDTAALASSIAGVLSRESVGFGYGALAAGADIVIAEALLAAGAELHVVLPTGIEPFVEQSVMPYGSGWEPRFRACLEAATSLRMMTDIRDGYEPLATQLAADVAMGSATLNARRIESEALQLLVIDEGHGTYGSGAYTARDGRRWAASGARQHLVRSPRANGVVASGLRQAPEGRPDRRLAAMLHIAVDGLDALDETAFADVVDHVLAPLRESLAALALQPMVTLPAGNARIVAFATPLSAWLWADAVLSLPLDGGTLRIAGHYALAHWLESPAALVGRGVAELQTIATAAMPGVVTVSETMASALFVDRSAAVRAEWIGEIGAMRLFSLTAGDPAQ